jgi:hypothetical protein
MKNTNEYINLLSELYDNSNQFYQKLILFAQNNAKLIDASFYHKLIDINNDFFSKNVIHSSKNIETSRQINTFCLSQVILLKNEAHLLHNTGLQPNKNIATIKIKIKSITSLLLILFIIAVAILLKQL